MELNNIINNIKSDFDKKDLHREDIFSRSRKIRRLSTSAIRDIHKGNSEATKALLDSLKKEIDELSDNDKALPLIQGALQEYAEAILTWSFLKKIPPPPPSTIGIPPEPYVLGLADSIGELRRYILDELRKNQLHDVEYFLDLMEDIFHKIILFDYPNAILPIRRKQDIARLLLEKTRGEVTVALIQAELSEKLEDKNW